jgi:hypothetical protein
LFIDDLIEVFFEFRIRVSQSLNNIDRQYERLKILREFIPSMCTHKRLLETVQSYIPIIFPELNNQQDQPHGQTQASASLEAANNIKDTNDVQVKETSEEAVTGRAPSVSASERNQVSKYRVKEIKLAERDSNGVDLEIDLVTDNCFINHPISPKSRFVVYIESEQ